MKRKLAFFLALWMVFSLAGCSRDGENEVGNVRETACEIALIVEGEDVEEDLRSRELWDGVQAYARTGGVTCQWFGTGASGIEDCEKAINEAISQGARVIVAGGLNCRQAVYSMEMEYLDVSFILMDGLEVSADDEGMTNDNIASVAFRDEQAGYLAGYAAVMEGYRSLGFLGGEEVPSSIRYGYGFVQGADAAAQELKIDTVDMKYHYLGHTQAGDDVTALAKNWYDSGVELIFAACGDAEASVTEAAESSGGKVIGTDKERLEDSEAVVTAVEKDLSQTVRLMLNEYYNGEFPGAQVVSLGIADGVVGLSTEDARLEEFSQMEYDELCQTFSAAKQSEDGDGAQEPSGPQILTEEVPIVNEIPTKSVYVSLVE